MGKCIDCNKQLVNKKAVRCKSCAAILRNNLRELGSFDTTQEICEGNINTRLREGFRLLQE